MTSGTMSLKRIIKDNSVSFPGLEVDVIEIKISIPDLSFTLSGKLENQNL